MAATAPLAWCHGTSHSPRRVVSGPYTASGTTDGYKVRVEAYSQPKVDEPTLLTFDITRGGRAIQELAIVHSKPLHLIAVSTDLGHFMHLHPEVIDRGRLALNTTFPEGGNWVLYADFMESGASHNTIVRIPLAVAGVAEHEHKLETTPRMVCDEPTGTDVTLSTDPERLQVGENMLTFTLRDAAGPVTDLEPVLGALGHLVLIKKGAASAKDYVHAHPMDTASSPADGGIQFHVEFPSAGTYKAWVEFNRAGRQVLVPYVFDVRKSSASTTQGQSAMYTCPMHPEVTSTVPGRCPKCGMNLKRMTMTPSPAPTRPHSEAAPHGH